MSRRPDAVRRVLRVRKHPKRRLAAALLLLFASLATSAAAEIQQRETLTCAGIARPGLATFRDGTWQGFEVDLCKTLARAILGPAGRVRFHVYGAEADFDTLRHGDDDVAFLSGFEVDERQLRSALVQGPTLLRIAQGVMVSDTSPITSLHELGEHRVCFIAGSLAEDALNDWLRVHGIHVERAPFSEEGEMIDAFRAEHCDAVAGETGWLAAQARLKRPSRRPDRVLAEEMATEPLSIYTPAARGQAWASTIFANLQFKAAPQARDPSEPHRP